MTMSAMSTVTALPPVPVRCEIHGGPHDGSEVDLPSMALPDWIMLAAPEVFTETRGARGFFRYNLRASTAAYSHAVYANAKHRPVYDVDERWLSGVIPGATVPVIAGVGSDIESGQ